ncbi:MAG: uroporphyrinogen-III C-methyltransferase [Thermoplasmataceae archaeon]
MPTGKVYFVGSGPGDPDLLTVRALRLLKSSDVVIYDSLVTQGILDLIPESAICVPIRGTPRAHGLKMHEVADLMIKHAQRGDMVVRLKSGDPIIFGRLWEETAFLEEKNIPYDIVPGITSALYSAMVSRTPLTDRRFSSSFAIVTGHEAMENSTHRVNWEKLAGAVDTLVVLMGATTIKDYAVRLLDAGANPEATTRIIFNASRDNQEVIETTLEEASNGIQNGHGDLCVVIISLSSGFENMKTRSIEGRQITLQD